MTPGRIGLRILKWLVVAGLAWVGAWIILFVLWGQPWRHRYSGEGKFTDYGFNPDGGRYVLELGRFDLTSSAGHARTFAIGPLPEGMNLVLYFAVADEEERSQVERLRFRARAFDAEGRTCVNYEGALLASRRFEEGVAANNEAGSGSHDRRVRLGAPCSGWSLFGLGAHPLTVEITQLEPVGRPLHDNTVLVELTDY